MVTTAHFLSDSLNFYALGDWWLAKGENHSMAFQGSLDYKGRKNCFTACYFKWTSAANRNVDSFCCQHSVCLHPSHGLWKSLVLHFLETLITPVQTGDLVNFVSFPRVSFRVEESWGRSEQNVRIQFCGTTQSFSTWKWPNRRVCSCLCAVSICALSGAKAPKNVPAVGISKFTVGEKPSGQVHAPIYFCCVGQRPSVKMAAM